MIERKYAPRIADFDAGCILQKANARGHESEWCPSNYRSALLAAWALIANFGYRARLPRSSITKPIVMLVPGGAVLGFDDLVHIDLDRSHTVLSPSDVRRFAAELKRIADAVDLLAGREVQRIKRAGARHKPKCAART